MIKIICVGKTTEFDEKIKYYNDRLNGIFQTKIQTINISEQNQSVKILSLLKSNEYIILLDERGEEINNMKLKDIICNFSHNLVFVIGGPFGVNEEVRKRANFIWKLSKLIFTYEMCRLFLMEQIYRSQEIFKNHPYHHG